MDRNQSVNLRKEKASFKRYYRKVKFMELVDRMKKEGLREQWMQFLISHILGGAETGN